MHMAPMSDLHARSHVNESSGFHNSSQRHCMTPGRGWVKNTRGRVVHMSLKRPQGSIVTRTLHSSSSGMLHMHAIVALSLMRMHCVGYSSRFVRALLYGVSLHCVRNAPLVNGARPFAFYAGKSRISLGIPANSPLPQLWRLWFT